MRSEGYYWVKEKGETRLKIAYYDQLSWWLLIGSNILYSDSDFDYIGKEIKEPKI